MSIYFALGGVLLFLLILIAARCALGSEHVAPWVEHLGDAQTILTIAAAIIAASWYFVERPHAAKVKFEQAVTGVPAPNGQVLALAEVSFTNLGSSSLDFRDTPYALFVQRVAPPPPAAVAEIGQRDPSGALLIHDGDRWASMATRHSTLQSFLDAGETENLYYRVAIPCQPDLQVYFTSWFNKPAGPIDAFFGRRNFSWVKQTLVDLSGQCAKSLAAAKAAAPPKTNPAAKPHGDRKPRNRAGR